MKKTIVYLFSCILLTIASFADLLQDIVARGELRVGTTGDYKPFSYYNEKTKGYEGYDIAAMQQLADSLKVKLVFVKTSWPTLMNDLTSKKFDIMAGGVTRTFTRQLLVEISKPYYSFGKIALVRKGDKNNYTTLASVDKPNVRIGVNPGGTSFEFIKANIKQAKVSVINNNLEIPYKIVENEIDVMITDSPEAILYSQLNPATLAVANMPLLTNSTFGYLVPKNETNWLNFVNLWIEESQMNGNFKALQNQWLK